MKNLKKYRFFSNSDKNSIVEVLKYSIALLNSKEKKSLKINIIISFFAGLFEIFSATTFYPLVGIIIQPDLVQKNKLINYIWEILGNPGQISFVVILSIFISITLIFSTFLNFLAQLFANRMSSSAEERLGNEMFTNLITVPYKWHLLNNPNITRNIILKNLNLWNKNVIRNIPSISGQLSGVLFAVLSILLITPKIGFILIVIAGLILSTLLKLIRDKSSKLMNKVREKDELINIFLTESLTGIKDIKVSSKENNFIKGFYKINHIIIKNYAAASNWNLLPTFVVVLFGQLSILITASSLFIIGVRGGDLASIMTVIILVFSKIIPLLNRFGSSLNNIANINSWIIKAVETVQNLEFEKNKFLVNENKKITNKKISWEKLTFSSVDFKYPESNNFVFKNLNLEIKKGLHYAFVGYSGAGKSTALDLFLGLLNPDEGEILIDDKNIIELGIRNWQNTISYIPQVPHISNLSLRQNIAFGVSETDIDNKRVNYCLRQTQLQEVSRNLSKGIYTELGNEGITLSGGQKQRVAISRALYSKPDILIMDEATSSLDAETEKIIQKTIGKLSKKITIISIAHRFSTIRNCDYIYLFDRGKIRGEGTYESLSSNNKLFRNLASEQMLSD
tara:strand:- start:1203 stop:3071 length:1869 start_codon:yes stop_codon:yes gene_type:complete